MFLIMYSLTSIWCLLRENKYFYQLSDTISEHQDRGVDGCLRLLTFSCLDSAYLLFLARLWIINCFFCQHFTLADTEFRVTLKPNVCLLFLPFFTQYQCNYFISLLTLFSGFKTELNIQQQFMREGLILATNISHFHSASNLRWTTSENESVWNYWSNLFCARNLLKSTNH